MSDRISLMADNNKTVRGHHSLLLEPTPNG